MDTPHVHTLRPVGDGRQDPFEEFESLLRQLEAEAESLVEASSRHPDGELYAMGRLRGLQEALACVQVVARDAQRKRC
jgi:hypothetical protein